MTRGVVLLGILLLFAAFDWLIFEAPFVACGLAALIAVAWSVFLDRMPELSDTRVTAMLHGGAVSDAAVQVVPLNEN